MTRDDIIRLAREAGLPDAISAHPGVQQLVRAAVEAERDACAGVAKHVSEAMAQRYGDGAECITTGEEISDAIRARGAADPT